MNTTTSTPDAAFSHFDVVITTFYGQDAPTGHVLRHQDTGEFARFATKQEAIDHLEVLAGRYQRSGAIVVRDGDTFTFDRDVNVADRRGGRIVRQQATVYARYVGEDIAH
jgi:hypothetical protein